MQVHELELDSTVDVDEVIEELEHEEFEELGISGDVKIILAATGEEESEGEELHVGHSKTDDDDEDEEDKIFNDGPSEPAMAAKATDVVPPVVVVKPVSKADIARRLFKEMYGKEGIARKDIIAKFISEAGLTIAGAATYYQLETTKLKKAAELAVVEAAAIVSTTDTTAVSE